MSTESLLIRFIHWEQLLSLCGGAWPRASIDFATLLWQVPCLELFLSLKVHHIRRDRRLSVISRQNSFILIQELGDRSFLWNFGNVCASLLHDWIFIIVFIDASLNREMALFVARLFFLLRLIILVVSKECLLVAALALQHNRALCLHQCRVFLTLIRLALVIICDRVSLLNINISNILIF